MSSHTMPSPSFRSCHSGWLRGGMKHPSFCSCHSAWLFGERRATSFRSCHSVEGGCVVPIQYSNRQACYLHPNDVYRGSHGSIEVSAFYGIRFHQGFNFTHRTRRWPGGKMGGSSGYGGRGNKRGTQFYRRTPLRPQPLTAFPGLRPLAPFRRPLTRGKFKPLSLSEQRAAMALAVREIQAESSRGPAASKLRTIERFLKCFNLSLIPFTVQVVYALGAALKWRKYRAAEQYLYMARATAERRGAVVSKAAGRAVTDMIRSCRRGLGPSRRCEGLIMENMPALPGSSASWAAGGPWRPRATLIVGAWYMLREVEFSNAELRAVFFNMLQQSVTLTLPVSKADPSALGTTVTHGCCCLSVALDASSPILCRDLARSRALCPFHQLLDHMTFMRRQYPNRFDRLGWPVAGYPLFPDEAGRVCTKEGVAATIRRAAYLLGQPTHDSGGLVLHTGHALRVTGAQALARAGLSEHQISLLARWGSAAVLKYIRTAPLASTHRMAAFVFAGWQSGGTNAQQFKPPATSQLSVFPACKARPKQVKKAGAPAPKYGARLATVEQRLAEIELAIKRLESWRAGISETASSATVSEAPPLNREAVSDPPHAASHAPYVLSGYGKVHEILIGHPAHPVDWITSCGWRFGASREAKPTETLPQLYKAYCENCFFSQRALVKSDSLHRVHEVGSAAQSMPSALPA